MQTLVLADNSISTLPLDAFSGLLVLETLDLHGNHLSVIDSGVFRDGMSRLSKVRLRSKINVQFCFCRLYKTILLFILIFSKRKQVPLKLLILKKLEFGKTMETAYFEIQSLF